MTNFTYEYSKDFSDAKIKTAAKADFIEWLTPILKEKFGEDKVKIVRTGGGQSFKNELGVQFGTVNIEGNEVPLTCTFSPVVKEFQDRQTAKKSYLAFDFEAAANRYTENEEEKLAKAKAKVKAE